ncbi:hypothetical protein DFJ74DRAFT_663515 [Hyaloraphidium curvatum]|nr:hypothetical protein DFJ74DRAFT_663515 [Hyaloraphidium curvatum]
MRPSAAEMQLGQADLQPVREARTRVRLLAQEKARAPAEPSRRRAEEAADRRCRKREEDGHLRGLRQSDGGEAHRLRPRLPAEAEAEREVRARVQGRMPTDDAAEVRLRVRHLRQDRALRRKAIQEHSGLGLRGLGPAFFRLPAPDRRAAQKLDDAVRRVARGQSAPGDPLGQVHLRRAALERAARVLRTALPRALQEVRPGAARLPRGVWLHGLVHRQREERLRAVLQGPALQPQPRPTFRLHLVRPGFRAVGARASGGNRGLTMHPRPARSARTSSARGGRRPTSTTTSRSPRRTSTCSATCPA